MNYSYPGSFAEENMSFSSGVDVASTASSEIFNSFAIYVPSNLAANNLTGVDVSGAKTKPIVVELTSENYTKVMKGKLLSDWEDIFNNGVNIAVKVYVVVFYVPLITDTDKFADFLTVEDLTINYSYLTTAFDLTYFCAFFKTMFSETLDGSDTNYTDLSLALSYLCKISPKMSANIIMTRVTLPLATTDTNALLFCSKTRAEEIAAATALNVTISGVTTPRVAYFWGMLNLMQAQNTWIATHSEVVNIMQEVFKLYFSKTNASGTYIGNKLSLIRLDGAKIKAFGTPSIFDSSVNVNAPLAVRELLDSKNISYLKAIGDGTPNDAMLIGARTVTGVPFIGLCMAKWIDYTMSQELTQYIADKKTLGVPVLRNEKFYKRIQDKLVDRIQTFSIIGRLTSISIDMPDFSELDPSKTDIVVPSAWSAEFIYDAEKVKMSGSIAA